MSTRQVSADFRGVATTAAVLVAATLGVHHLQPRLAERVHATKETEDVYLFPPPAELRAVTLGYIAATTDILWGKLLVEHGSHWAEHRPFVDLNRYLDAIIGLEPTFLPFYEYVDTLLCYRPPRGGEADARAARAYLERGIQVLPNDPEVWLHYGQFIGFLAPSFLTSDAERDRWRRDGAIALNRAVELGAEVSRGIAASEMLGRRFGQRDAEIEGLERAYVIADDDAYRLEIAAKLEQLQASRKDDLGREAVRAVESRWRRDYPFLDRGTFLLVGPKTDPLRCAGPAAAVDHDCGRDWDSVLAP